MRIKEFDIGVFKCHCLEVDKQKKKTRNNLKSSKKNDVSLVAVWKTHKQLIVFSETLNCAYVL